MSISLTRYVNITSGLGGGNQVPTRLLIARVFTGNLTLPPQTFLQFSNAADVGTYFGLYSEEYNRALFYFSWISKNLTSPQAIQFARWVETATAPMIYPAPSNVTTVAAWTSISTATLTLTIGGVTNTITMSSTPFTGLTTFAEIATVIETAIQAETGSGAQWTGATVTYVASGNNPGFQFVGGLAGSSGLIEISVTPTSTGTDISGAGFLGWQPGSEQSSIFSDGVYSANANWVPGSPVETITQTLTNSVNVSNNFGSFLFLNNLALNASQIGQAATWNNSQNVMYLYTAPVTVANYASVVALLALTNPEGTGLTLIQSPIVISGTLTSASNVVTGMTGVLENLQIGMPVSGSDIPAGTVILSLQSDTSITLSQNANGSATTALTFATVQFPEQLPAMIEAATNYAGINSVQNYMFQQASGLTPTVNSDSQAATYDAISVNYYGNTQTAGVNISFYQRGLLQGSGVVTNITDMTSYVNEIWLKDAIGAAIMNLLLSLAQIPANPQGRSQILTVIQNVIVQALLNGTISVGKMLNTTQQAFITNAANNPDAWYQVQNDGYWIDAVISVIPSTSPVQYQLTYTLIYSKDDVIRLVVGSDILI